MVCEIGAGGEGARGEEVGEVPEECASAAEPAIHGGDVVEALLQLHGIVHRRIQILHGACKAR
jgi:hypothetical protein